MSLLLFLGSCAPPERGDLNWVGAAHVVVGTSWLGSETRTVVASDLATVLCEETYALSGSHLYTECPECTFAFSLEVTDVVTDGGRWCEDFGVGTTGWSQEMDPGLGWDAVTGYMAYQDERYGWDIVEGTTATWTGDELEGDLTWDWNGKGRDFYGYE